MHPIAVIELLWRSCCAPDVEKLAGGLGTRLKVRQWTQLLVDQSLLLGSSSEGIHLHDIVLTSLRKRLSAEELRAEHKKVIEGIVAASQARMSATGQGMQDTGSTGESNSRSRGLPRFNFLTRMIRTLCASWIPTTSKGFRRRGGGLVCEQRRLVPRPAG